MSESTNPNSDPRQRASDLANNVVEDAARVAEEKAGEVALRAEEQADSIKHQAAERVETVADSLKAAHDRLSGDEDRLAGWIGDAATELENFSHSLRDKSMGELIGDVEEFGRRRPEVLIGSSVALGFALARFGKASAERRRSPSTSTSAPGSTSGVQSTSDNAHTATTSSPATSAPATAAPATSGAPGTATTPPVSPSPIAPSPIAPGYRTPGAAQGETK